MITSDALTHPKLRSLLDFWRARLTGNYLPSRASIDPIDMKPWLGNLLLIEVSPDEGFRYRLYGSEFVMEFGREMTGQTLEALNPEHRELIEAEYRAACEHRQPMARRYTASFDWLLPSGQCLGKRTVTWERLSLPLARDGVTVDMLLVGAYPLEEITSE
jgi:hypothetical protein